MHNNGAYRKKNSARIVWDMKPRRAPNPKGIEFQAAIFGVGASRK